MWTASKLIQKRLKYCVFVLLLFLLYHQYFIKNEPNLLREESNKTDLSAAVSSFMYFMKTQTLENELDKQALAESSLNIISEKIKSKINFLQRQASCNITLLCGHQDNCGLGCQLHHRAMCLALSFILEAPLIHEIGSWFYTDPWEQVFQPLGSRCKDRGSETKYSYVVRWPRLLIIETNGAGEKIQKPLPFPLKDGIPLPSDLKNDLVKWHPRPFVWLAGLFLNETMKLNAKFENELIQWREQMQFTSPLIGVHVRRTDKILEEPLSHHETHEYIDIVHQYFNGWATMNQYFHKQINPPRSVYVATDDISVLKNIQRVYTKPEWNIMGQNQLPSYAKFGFKSVVKDILMLVSTDFVICGLSSNLCRLVYELKTFRESSLRNDFLHSMELTYNYPLKDIFIPTNVIEDPLKEDNHNLKRDQK